MSKYYSDELEKYVDDIRENPICGSCKSHLLENMDGDWVCPDCGFGEI